MERREIGEALKTCEFTDVTQRNFIVYTENFDLWRSFTLVDFDALATISVTAPFHISATKLLCFAVLKFWIEEKIRINEFHLTHQFRQDITLYFQLYQTFIAAKFNNDHVAHRPQFSSDDWNGFKTGTNDYLGLIQGSGRVPLSYVIRDDAVHPVITTGSSHNIKIHWNAPLFGTIFGTDHLCVWTYLLHRYSEIHGWFWIQQYRATNNGREAWFALSCNHGVVAIVSENEPSYEDDDYI